MDNDRSSSPNHSIDSARPSAGNGVDETEREVITSGTAATSEVGDPAAQESARQQPGGPVDTTDATREDGQDSGNSADREDREPRG
jgi:hypothetical protein